MSNNLGLDQVAGNQDLKEITINDQAGQLDAALTDTLAVAVTSSNAVTLTSAQFQRAQFIVIDEDGGDPATAAITITVPALARGLFTIVNDTAFVVTVEVSGQTKPSPTVRASGGMVLLICDAADVTVSGAAGTYDVGSAFGGTPTASEAIFVFVFPRAVTLPAGLTDSQGQAVTAATSSTTFDIKKNGANSGTMVFAAAGTVATFAMATDTVFAAGDTLSIVGPGTPDATIAGLIFTIVGVR